MSYRHFGRFSRSRSYLAGSGSASQKYVECILLKIQTGFRKRPFEDIAKKTVIRRVFNRQLNYQKLHNQNKFFNAGYSGSFRKPVVLDLSTLLSSSVMSAI